MGHIDANGRSALANETLGVSFLRPLGHLTSRYIVNRIRQSIWQWRHPDAPWLAPAAVLTLDRMLAPDWQGVEWGSGRSTLWFARHVRHIISVEHNQKWGTWVTGQLDAQGLSGKVDYRVCPGDGQKAYGASYVSALEGVENKTLDFGLVDGKARHFCALSLIPKLKPGGLLIVDNVERYVPRAVPSSAPTARGMADGYANPHWEQVASLIRDWPCQWFSNGISDTAIWTRPLDGS